MNAFEQIGRERKAQAIARLFWRHLPREVRTSTEMVEALRLVNQEERDSFARCAGQKPPSEETWARVCAIVAENVADERRWVGLDKSAPVGEQLAAS